MAEDQPQGKGLSANWAVREVDHLFHRAARYTRFVFYSKWSLAGFAILLITLLMIYPLLRKDDSGMRITFSGTGTKASSDADNPTMNNPVYEGTDKNNRPFRITGKRAIQMGGGVVKVEQVEGQLVLQNDNFVSVTADSAEYRQEQHTVDLIGNVRVVQGDGYTFVTNSARIDTDTQEISGKEQIAGEGPQGNLLATGFQIVENGKRILFGGSGRVNVKVDRTK